MDHQTEGQNKVKPQEDVHELPRSIDEVTPHPVTILQNANYDKVCVLIGSLGREYKISFSTRIRNLIYLRIFAGHLDIFWILLYSSIHCCKVVIHSDL